jgi:hypothetical protein
MKNQISIRKVVCTLGFFLSLSGCRFGNYADSPTQINQSDITSSELFFTNVTGFETYVFLNDGTSAANTNSPLEAVPSDLLSVFTNPVFLVTDVNQNQYFWDNAQSANPIQTLANAAGQINVEMDTPDSPTQFYQNPDCLTQIIQTQQGALNRTAPGTTVLPGTVVNTPVAGHLQLDVTVLQTFTGTCSDDLQELANCFQDGTGCDSDQLSRAQMFDLFVRGTQVLNIQNAAKITKLAYIVHFE